MRNVSRQDYMPEVSNGNKDSPTCSRKGSHLSYSVIASNKWTVNSLYLKITLFQGKIIEHTVFARSSEESKTKKVGKLRNCVYKLADASRLCYLKLKKELIMLRATSSILDKGILAWTKEQIFIFIVSCLADDVFWTGNQEFRYIIK